MGSKEGIEGLVGRTLGGFLLKEKIGAGGFSTVFRAEQSQLGREAVVKIIHPAVIKKSGTDRFLREARLASQLDHPFAAHVYAFGTEDDGTLWIAMEYVRGTPLDVVLSRKGSLPLDKLAPFFERLCEVVQTAHEQGIVHRDIKPANIMVLTRAGRLLPKLLDLGIAKVFDGVPGGPSRESQPDGVPLSDSLDRALSRPGESRDSAPIAAVSPATRPSVGTMPIPMEATDANLQDAPRSALSMQKTAKREAAQLTAASIDVRHTADSLQTSTARKSTAQPVTGESRESGTITAPRPAQTDAEVDDWAPQEIAKVTLGETQAGADKLTRDGQIVGSPPYMAPEQWRSANQVGSRTDIYALGVLLFETLTSAPPFIRNSVRGYAFAHVHEPVPPIRDSGPSEVDVVIAKAMAKRPEDRYASATELGAALRFAVRAAKRKQRIALTDVAKELVRASAPFPIAEAAAAIDLAPDPAMQLLAIDSVVEAICKYLGSCALSAYVRSSGSMAPPPALQAALTTLDGGGPGRESSSARRSAARWLAIAQAAVAPWAARPDAFSVPELARLLPLDDFATESGSQADANTNISTEISEAPSHQLGSVGSALHAILAADDGDEAHVVAATQIVRLERAIRGLARMHQYEVVVRDGDELESWRGLRKTRRLVDDGSTGAYRTNDSIDQALMQSAGEFADSGLYNAVASALYNDTFIEATALTIALRDLPEGVPVLLSRVGQPVLILGPVISAAVPSPGLPQELFFTDGPGRHGMRQVSTPRGFERFDGMVASWLFDNFAVRIGEAKAVSGERVPYRGLATFTADDADMFFGREREVEAFVNRLRMQGFLAVVGPSGTGKSSFVQAGVIPALGEGWRKIVVRPGQTPIATLLARLSADGVDLGLDGEAAANAFRQDPRLLGRALEEAVANQLGEGELSSVVISETIAEASPGMTDELAIVEPGARSAALKAKTPVEGILLVVDQFEELVTLCQSGPERDAYAAALVATAGADSSKHSNSKVRVVLTLRDDFLVRMEQLTPLRQKLSRGLALLTTPSADDLRRIVTEPAVRAGYKFEDGKLVDEMVMTVTDRPGALALLSFAASKLWEHRDKQFKLLTRRGYDAAGGVAGALGQHAEGLLGAMSERERPLVREAFRHLVTAEGTRAVLSRDELVQLMGGVAGAAAGDAERVLEQLIVARLLVATESETGPERIEVIHEMLLSSWPRLAGWLREDAENARLRDQLRTAARQWADRGRARGLLWRDEALAEYRLWRARYPGAVTSIEQAFADASNAADHRARRIKRGLLISAVSILAVGLVVLFAANRRTEKQRKIAVASQQEAVAAQKEAKGAFVELLREQGRLAWLRGDPRVAVDYLNKAVRASRATEDDLYLLSEAQRSIGKQAWALADNGPTSIQGIISLPTPDRALVAERNGTVSAIEESTGKVLSTFKIDADIIDLSDANDPAWATIITNRGIVLVEKASLRQVSFDHPSNFSNAAIDIKQGLVCTTGNETKTVRLWALTSGQLIKEITLPFKVRSPSFSADGKSLAIGGSTNQIALWAVAGMRAPRMFTVQGEGQTRRVRFLKNGTLFVGGGVPIQLFAWPTLQPIWRGDLRSENTFAMAFSEDETTLTMGSASGEGLVWDLSTGNVRATLKSPTNSVLEVYALPENEYLLFDQLGYALRTDDQGVIMQRISFVGAYTYVNFLPRSGLFAFASPGASLVAKSIRAGASLVASHNLGAPVFQVFPVAPDTLWAATVDGKLESLNTTTGVVAVTPVLTSPHRGNKLTLTAASTGIAVFSNNLPGVDVLTTGSTAWVHHETAATGVLAAVLTAKGIAFCGNDDRLYLPKQPALQISCKAMTELHGALTVAGEDGRLIAVSLTGNELWALQISKTAPVAVSAINKGLWAISFEDGSSTVVDLVGRRVLAKVPGDQGGILATALSPDSQLLALGHEDGFVRVWSLKSAKQLSQYRPHMGTVLTVIYVSDGKRLISGSDDGTVKVADTTALASLANCWACTE